MSPTFDINSKNKIPINSGRNLLLCRTPFQATICSYLNEINHIRDFDLLYLTNNDSALDRACFSVLAKNSQNSHYLNINPSRFNIITSIHTILQVERIIEAHNYNRIYLASLDALPFLRLARNQSVEVVTFDDGAANIIKPGIFDSHQGFRDRIYRFLARAPTTEDIIARSILHYSVYPKFENVAPKEKLYFINLFEASNSKSIIHKPGKRYFVGQPFSEYLNRNELNSLRNALKRINIDYYVRHPRERNVLLPNVELLDVKGEIAEKAIIRSSGAAIPTIYACFSSTLLNIQSNIARKVYISVSKDSTEKKRISLMRQAGCRIIPLSLQCE